MYHSCTIEANVLIKSMLRCLGYWGIVAASSPCMLHPSLIPRVSSSCCM